MTGFHKGGAGSASVIQASFGELWDGLSGWALRELKPALSPKGSPDPRESSAVQARRAATNCGAIIVVPVIFKGKVLGTLTAINRPDQRDFEQQDVDLLLALANPLAAAIENNRLYLAMAAEVQERQRAEAALQQAYAAAEREVAERTRALLLTNQALEQQIRERTKVEETLRQSEENLKRAQAVAHTGSWVLDIANNRLEWSAETYRIFGLPPGRAIHHEDFVACVHPEDRAAVAAAWDAALQGAAYALEHRVIAGGQTRWVWEQAELEFDPQGTPVRGVGSVQDITARKLAEDALQESEARYRAIFEGAKEGIIAVNHRLNAFVFVNPAMCALFGYTPQEFLQLNVPALHPPADLPQVLAEFAALTSGQKQLATNIPCQRKDGEIFYADIKVAVTVIDGAPFSIGFFHDVTERRRSEALLQARLRLSTLAPDATLDELLQKTLDEAEFVTGSKIGYFHFLDADQVTLSLQNWSTNTLANLCTAAGKGEHYPVDQAGVWADAVRAGKAVIYNDYASLPNRKGMPDGHAPVTRLVSVPVQRNGEIVALIGVGNKGSDYDQQDVDAVALLATEVWDIILRKRVEASLRESEERYRTLIESQEAVIAAIDAEGRHHYMNAIGAQLLQRTVAEIVGKRLHDLFPPQNADRQLSNIRRVISTGQGMTEEAADVWDGKVRWNRTSIQPLRNADGQVTLALISSVDITDRKETELILEERVQQRTAEIQSIRERLELATRAAGIGIWDWNCLTGELIWDDQMFQVYGVTRATYDGTIHGWEKQLHPADRLAQQELIAAVWRRECEYDTEFRVRWPNGAEHYVRSAALTLFDAEGRAVRMIGVDYDITVTKQAEQLLRQSEDTLRRANLELERAIRMKDDFLASMSHELRTPLTGILGLAEVLQYASYGELNAKQLKAVSTIETSGRHLLDLINDILDVSKMEAGKLDLQLEPAFLDEVCQASLALVKGLAQKKRQTLRFAVDPAGATVQCDKRRLKQMLVNLLSNAVKFTPESGVLGLEAVGDPEAQIMRLSVWDKGVGIAPEDLPKLFKPFVQLDSSLTRQQMGTGLGLALVSRLAALHGGSISVESTPGEGSRFTIALPWQPEQPAQETPVGRELEPVVQRTLTVEDNELDAARLTRFLRQSGIENIVHAQGRGAVEHAAEMQPGVILLDLNLPDLSGWNVLKALKASEQTRHIPVVITSVEEDRVRATALGAAAYLVKPVAPEELRAALEKAQTQTPRPQPVLVIAAAQTGPLVMVVDDNEINIDTMRDFLESRDFRVAPARSGWECLERITAVRPDLVLMDIQMPGMDGLETTRRIRALNDPGLAAVPIIAVTALAMHGDRERCLAAGANSYLAKPMRMQELFDQIDALLKERSQP